MESKTPPSEKKDGEPLQYQEPEPEINNSLLDSNTTHAQTPQQTCQSYPCHQQPAPEKAESENTTQPSHRPSKSFIHPIASSIKYIKPLALSIQASWRQKPLHKRHSFWISIGVASIGGASIAVILAFQTLERSLPPTDEIFTFVREGTLTIKAADETILQQIGPATREKLKIEQIPDKLVKAFIASEDRRFYKHAGIDFQGILRATISNFLAGNVVEGASTITQQLARIVFLNQEPSIKRKILEALLALKIEREMKKEQILERYLNLVYLGAGAYGVADAAWVYFGKTVDKLTLAEMAMIAGLPPAPTDYSPLVNPKVARARRNLVLEDMLEAGYITAAEAKAAKAEELKLAPKTPKRLQLEAPYFTSYIQKELPKYISREALEIGGLTVETTLNFKWQKYAEKAVKDAVEIDGVSQGFEQAALVAIDPRNGEVKAMVGGTNFADSQFNRVTQAQRQPGSTFKSFVYTAAIAAGFSPYDGYRDAPMSIDGYKPANYGNSYSGGWLSMLDALTKSTNVVAVRVLADVGFEPTIKLAHQMGIKSELKPYYALALGAIEVNLLELTSAYGTLAAQGKHVEVHGIRRVINGRGEVLYEAKFQPKQVLDKDSAAIMTWMLQSVVNNGTGRPAYINRPVAGKTGTSEEARDLWFIGYIPQLVTGVWLGNDDSYPTWGSSGTAAFTWHEFMSKVVEGMPVEEFPKLPNLEGRKGSIVAKPVEANISYYDFQKPQENAGTSGYTVDSAYYNNGVSSEQYSDGGYSGGYQNNSW
ncbi:MAG TPA: penicillin-binding protein 1A [Oscillatoriaceae cyanobacterium M7585_C2015_266]|nr:penicillin-binding protein 1A [Oscillatoriaceae cyanobacterium M7585_C2015_266]